MRRFLRFALPVPLLALEGEGEALLAALRWLEENARRVPLREEIIRQYHRQILEGRLPRVGDYRQEPVSITGSGTQPPSPARVSPLMKQMGLGWEEAQRRLDQADTVDREAVLRLSLEAYRKIGWIHPFVDGNGRVARLAMNHLLRRYGVGYVILPALSEEPRLMVALEEAHRGTLEPMLEIARKNLVPI